MSLIDLKNTCKAVIKFCAHNNKVAIAVFCNKNRFLLSVGEP